MGIVEMCDEVSALEDWRSKLLCEVFYVRFAQASRRGIVEGNGGGGCGSHMTVKIYKFRLFSRESFQIYLA